MKFGFLLILISVSVLLSGCKQSALGYNDRLIGPQVSIAQMTDTLFSENTEYPKIAELRKKIVDSANRGLSESLKSGDYEGNSEFRDRSVQYYSYVGSYFSDDELDSLIYLLNSADRIQKLDSIRLRQLQKDLNTFLKIEDELLRAQKDFAKEFGLRLSE